MNSKFGKTNALVLALSLSLGVSGIGLATAQTNMADSMESEQPVTDTWITTKVKAELATTDGVKSTDISVSTTNGNVTLTGTQESKTAHDRAVAAARSVQGVNRVDSSGLRVSAAAAGNAKAVSHDDDDSDQPVTDTWITTKVKAELATADDVKSLDISVTTTNGEVTLTGTQESKADVAKAVAAAKSVKGVRSVDATGLKVSAAKASSRTAADHDDDSDQPVTDTWITTKVKAELATTDNVKSTDISVTTTDGVVALIGTQESKMAVDRAVAAAKSVKGVRSVEATGLKVSAAKTASRTAADHDDDSDQPVTDTWITTKVKAELATTDNVKSMDISVTTTDGVVALIGTQDSKMAIDRAVAAAKSVKGVRSVEATGLKVSASKAASRTSANDHDSDQPVTDTWITTKVKAELATTDGVKSMDISVTTVNGEVALTGTQESKVAVDKAVAAAKSVKGVNAVDASGLKVSAMKAKGHDDDSDQPVTDTWITTKVKAELATTDGVDSSDIKVTTTDGKVTLIGALASKVAVEKAVAATRSVKGVRDVDASGLKSR